MKYHTTNEDLEKDLNKIETRVPNYATVSSLGNSVNGLELWSLRLTNRNPTDLTPMVKLVGMFIFHMIEYGKMVNDYGGIVTF